MDTRQLKVPSATTFGTAPITSAQEETTVMEQVSSQASETKSDQSISAQVLEKQKQASEALPIKISITLPTNAYFASGIRDFSMTLARNMSGFSKQWAYRFQSVVDELINNAIEFGSKPGDDMKITFVSMENQYIEVFVEDAGTGQGGLSAGEISSFVDARKNLDPTSITSMRGRGLSQIVSKWADKLDIIENEKGGVTAHVVKKFQKDEEMVIPL